MKIVFLDIDGVLNGADYQMAAKEPSPLIDKSRLPILKELIEKSGAKVVLSSSWKKSWGKGCSFAGVFEEAGVEIYDTTPIIGRRSDEIAAWLNAHPETESFVILDDTDGGWGALQPNVIVTNPFEQRGLEQEHVPLALEILAKK